MCRRNPRTPRDQRLLDRAATYSRQLTRHDQFQQIGGDEMLLKSPCAMRSTRPEPQRWSGKSVMIIHSIRTGAEPVPARDQTTAEQRRSL